MSPKKNSRGKKARSGCQLSGNPQRREEQLQARSDLTYGPQPSGMYSGLGFGSLLSPEPASGPPAWWQPSHERIIQQSHTLPESMTTQELDSRTCVLVGEEYWSCLQREEMNTFGTPWLEALVAAVEQAARDGIATSSWRGPWLLLQGMTSWAPDSEPWETRQSPYQAAVRATRKVAKVLSSRGLLSGERNQQVEPALPRVVDAPVLVRDAYGSRVALLASFAYGGSATDTTAPRDPHWYCWDVDQCSTPYIAAAGVFGSMEEALAEWRQAVGPAAPDSDTVVSCIPRDVGELLADELRGGPFGDMRMGYEPRERMLEWFRSERRAHEVATHLDVTIERTQPEELEEHIADFCSWYAARNGTEPDQEDVATLADEWCPFNFRAPLLYACSPHRITQATILITDQIMPEYVPGIMRLMPEWVEWCIERSGLSGELAERARAAAQEAVNARRPAGGWDEWVADPETGERPFRWVE